ncbi:hypothetical protein L211DRAFT_673031 [Terfezia boudieri ATCC MYA-4762]|uniref:Uncharacterized protein n=1 Tax=Terfezia boudieri ATCC MYA-4762 TaxID=1051890 RepID=A0A3N4LB10_9PEZI|nr:hypothetical protein L211DRAFT_673031 [Terfezia boudieri ATCC MYA-4762]
MRRTTHPHPEQTNPMTCSEERSTGDRCSSTRRKSKSMTAIACVTLCISITVFWFDLGRSGLLTSRTPTSNSRTPSPYRMRPSNLRFSSFLNSSTSFLLKLVMGNIRQGVTYLTNIISCSPNHRLSIIGPQTFASKNPSVRNELQCGFNLSLNSCLN